MQGPSPDREMAFIAVQRLDRTTADDCGQPGTEALMRPQLRPSSLAPAGPVAPETSRAGSPGRGSVATVYASRDVLS